MRISYSRASSYLSCPQKHNFSYVQNLRVKKAVRPLSFGSDFHKLLEFRNNKVAFKKAFSEIKEAYYELTPMVQLDLGENYLDTLKTIFNDYRRYYKGAEEPIETEHEFSIQIGRLGGELIEFYGFIDEIYPDVLGEHKTFSQAPDLGILAMNMQACLYAKAYALETGIQLKRVRWDYIKSTQSKYPIWLAKSMRFSESANQNITPYSWRRACMAQGITNAEIMLKGLNYQQNLSNFFFKCDIEFIPSMIETVWQDFKQVCKDVAIRGDKNKVKNISRDCSWCSFRPICYGEFTGADVEYIKKTDYIVKERDK